MKKLLSLFVVLVVLFSFNVNLYSYAEIFYANDSYIASAQETPEQDNRILKQDKKAQKEQIKTQKQQEKAQKQQEKAQKKETMKQEKLAQKQAKEEQKQIKTAQKQAKAEEKKAKTASKNQDNSNTEQILTKSEKKKAEKEAKKIAKAEKKAKNSENDNTKATQTRQNGRFPELKAKSPMSSNPNYGTDTPIGRELVLLDRSGALKKRSPLAVKLNPNLDIREVRASHILVKKRKDALMIKKDIESGVISFEEAAKKYSLCPSGVRGGDLGFFTRDKMEPQFSERAFDTKLGTISDPVGTKFGWHLIKTTDKR